LYLPREQAAERVRREVGRMSTEADAPGTIPRFRTGTALGLCGLSADAHALLAQAQGRYPESTFITGVLIPSTRAAIALGQGRPAEAVEALRAARATELGSVAGLVPLYLRGEALLRQGSTAEAIQEYERLLANRGVDPLSPVVPLAHLGIARAKARSGDAGGSRLAYNELFAAWEHADADLPVMLAARAEYARVASVPASAAAGRASRHRAASE
jgi:hypothetical protein